MSTSSGSGEVSSGVAAPSSTPAALPSLSAPAASSPAGAPTPPSTPVSSSSSAPPPASADAAAAAAAVASSSSSSAGAAAKPTFTMKMTAREFVPSSTAREFVPSRPPVASGPDAGSNPAQGAMNQQHQHIRKDQRAMYSGGPAIGAGGGGGAVVQGPAHLQSPVYFVAGGGVPGVMPPLQMQAPGHAAVPGGGAPNAGAGGGSNNPPLPADSAGAQPTPTTPAPGGVVNNQPNAFNPQHHAGQHKPYNAAGQQRFQGGYQQQYQQHAPGGGQMSSIQMQQILLQQQQQHGYMQGQGGFPNGQQQQQHMLHHNHHQQQQGHSVGPRPASTSPSPHAGSAPVGGVPPSSASYSAPVSTSSSPAPPAPPPNNAADPTPGESLNMKTPPATRAKVSLTVMEAGHHSNAQQQPNAVAGGVGSATVAASAAASAPPPAANAGANVVQTGPANTATQAQTTASISALPAAAKAGQQQQGSGPSVMGGAPPRPGSYNPTGTGAGGAQAMQQGGGYPPRPQQYANQQGQHHQQQPPPRPPLATPASAGDATPASVAAAANPTVGGLSTLQQAAAAVYAQGGAVPVVAGGAPPGAYAGGVPNNKGGKPYNAKGVAGGQPYGAQQQQQQQPGGGKYPPRGPPVVPGQMPPGGAPAPYQMMQPGMFGNQQQHFAAMNQQQQQQFAQQQAHHHHQQQQAQAQAQQQAQQQQPSQPSNPPSQGEGAAAASTTGTLTQGPSPSPPAPVVAATNAAPNVSANAAAQPNNMVHQTSQQHNLQAQNAMRHFQIHAGAAALQSAANGNLVKMGMPANVVGQLPGGLAPVAGGAGASASQTQAAQGGAPVATSPATGPVNGSGPPTAFQGKPGSPSSRQSKLGVKQGYQQQLNPSNPNATAVPNTMGQPQVGGAGAPVPNPMMQMPLAQVGAEIHRYQMQVLPQAQVFFSNALAQAQQEKRDPNTCPQVLRTQADLRNASGALSALQAVARGQGMPVFPFAPQGFQPQGGQPQPVGAFPFVMPGAPVPVAAAVQPPALQPPAPTGYVKRERQPLKITTKDGKAVTIAPAVAPPPTPTEGTPSLDKEKQAKAADEIGSAMSSLSLDSSPSAVPDETEQAKSEALDKEAASAAQVAQKKREQEEEAKNLKKPESTEVAAKAGPPGLTGAPPGLTGPPPGLSSLQALARSLEKPTTQLPTPPASLAAAAAAAAASSSSDSDHSLRPGGVKKWPSVEPSRGKAEKFVYDKKFLMSMKDMEICHRRPGELMRFEPIQQIGANGMPRQGSITRASSAGSNSGAPSGQSSGWRQGQSQGQTPGKQSSARGGVTSPAGAQQWDRGKRTESIKSGPGARTSGGGNNRGGGGGGQMRDKYGNPAPPLYDGPIAPLARGENGWKPEKNKSSLDALRAKAKSLLNKMTKTLFETLAAKICAIEITSMDMLDCLIGEVFDKAIMEPTFADMYADLCFRMSQNVKPDSFLRYNICDEEGKFYWCADVSTDDTQVIGPFEDADLCIYNATDPECEEEPIDRGAMTFEIVELCVRQGTFIKVMRNVEEPSQFYVVYFGLGDSGLEKTVAGPFENENLCMADAQKKNSFKRALLDKCQDEFDKFKNKSIYDDYEAKKKEYETSKASMTQQQQTETEEDLEFLRVKLKKRFLGNVKFIGELYKKGMLKENVMHECICQALKVKPVNENGTISCIKSGETLDEEEHEVLGKLFTTIGLMIDKHAKDSWKLEVYFEEIKSMSRDMSLSHRIRFLYENLIDLRANRWIPRRADDSSKTLDEIRREADREERAAAQTSMGGGRSGGYSQQRGGGGSSDQYRNRGSSSVSSTQQQSASGRDSRSMSSSSMPRTSSGASVKAAAPQQHTAAPSSYSRPAAPAVRGGGGAGASESNSSVRLMARPGATSSDKQVPFGASKDAPSSAAVPDADGADDAEVEEMDEDRLKLKVKSMMQEYLSLQDEDNLLACWDEICAQPKAGSMTVADAVEHALSLSKIGEREMVLAMLVKLFEEERLTTEHLHEGLDPIVENLSDLKVDIPKAVIYFAKFMAVLIEKQAVNLEWFCKALEKLGELDDNCVHDLISEIEKVSSEECKVLMESCAELGSLRG